MTPNSKKFHYIDCLRGIAIVLVIATHLKGIIPNCSDVSNSMLSFGRMGVQLFFLVSACTLYLSWQNRSGESTPLIKFYLRRYFRIAPLYYLGIVLYCALAALSHYQSTGRITWPEQFQPFSVIFNVFLTHGFYPPGNNNIVPGGWSIATEFLFYIIFPLLIALLTKKGTRAWLVFVAVYITTLLCVHAIAASWGFQMTLGDYGFHSILNQLPIFLFGITAAHLRNAYLAKTQWITDLIAFPAFLSISLLIWNSPHSVMMSVLPLMVGAAFVFLMYFMSRIPDRFFESFLAPMCWIGKISFSMYICHFMIIDFLKATLPTILFQGRELSLLGLYFTTILATALVSHFSEKLIESNGIRLGKSVIARLAVSQDIRSKAVIS